MDIRRLLHHPDDGGWFVIGETRSEAEMLDFRRSLKRNAIINTHLVNCTMNHDHALNGLGDLSHIEHKMKVQWTKCTSALCHPKTLDHDDDDDDVYFDEHHYNNNHNSSVSSSSERARKPRACPVQLRMSTCQLTFVGIVCQAYQHLSDEHDSAEPMQSSVTEDMKIHVVRMLEQHPDVKPMIIYKELLKLHRSGEFGADLMPTKIQLRNALTYLRSRKLKAGGATGSNSNNNNYSSAGFAVGREQRSGSSDSSASSTSSLLSLRKRTFDSFSEGSASPPCDEHRLSERASNQALKHSWR